MSNQKYQKVLFVGARGTWDKMPFEVLGSGLVNYRVSLVGDPEDSGIIGQNYPATEYYCLANNGQTWYFAISDEELYYCRELDFAEILKIKTQIGMENKNLSEFFGSPGWIKNWELDEGGNGKLQSATGRGMRDLRNFANFEYYDFDSGGKSYSLDLFPDQNGKMTEEEWFETKWVPQSELTRIFADSLRLGNPNSEKILKKAKLWQKIMILSLISAVLILVFAVFQDGQKLEVWSQNKELSSNQKEVIFENIKVEQINQIHTISTRLSLPAGRGLSLNFSFLEGGNLVSNSIQEYTNSGTNSSVSTQNNTFFPQEIKNYKAVVKIQDYGVLGQTRDCTTTSANNPQNIIKSINSQSNFSSSPSFDFGQTTRQENPQNNPNQDSENGENSQNNTQSSTNSLTTCSLEIPKIDLTIKILKGGIWWPVWIFASIVCFCFGIIALSIQKNLESQVWKI